MTRLHQPLISRFKEVLQQEHGVVAAWLEGSIARHEDDDVADIDLWIAVGERSFTAFIDAREQWLSQCGTVVSVLYPKELENTEEDIDTLHVLFEELPPSVGVDITVVKKTRPIRFVEGSTAQECVVLFDTEHIIKHKSFDPAAVEDYVEQAYDDVVVRFWHELPRIQTFLERDDLLEAFRAYLQRLEDVVTLYRLWYTPEKIDWGLKDMEYDLPEQVVKDMIDLMPKLQRKSIERNTRKLAKTFVRQGKALSKRLQRPFPTTLAQYVLDEL